VRSLTFRAEKQKLRLHAFHGIGAAAAPDAGQWRRVAR
jgi:hypothetical protein